MTGGLAIDNVVLVLFGVIALVAAASMLVIRQPMRVALALVTVMMMLGGIYGLLGVHFLAAFQVLIYVGAVMVFMVYVIMLLEVREPAEASRYSGWLLPGLGTFGLLMAVLGAVVGRDATARHAVVATDAFTLTAFSTEFLSRYWLEFELTTVLLVAAIVAALAVIKVSRRTHG
jgi:NADH-quinone oxidoreductase subunit J